MIRATEITKIDSDPVDTVTLTYEDRFKRRITMSGDNGFEFLLDLPKVSDLKDGDDLLLEDGQHIRVRSGDETVAKITASSSHQLMRIIWHIGNRHIPCQIMTDEIFILPDHVIEEMVAGLGGTVEHISQPFIPESGAYGHGRTHSHEH